MNERVPTEERRGGLRVPAWLPNAISVARLLLVPLLALLLLRRRLGEAAALIVLAALSDALDGWLARRYRLETKSGAFLDPLADKLTQATVLVLLAGLGKVPWWLFALVLGRELLLVYGALRIRLARRKVTIRARLEGKLSTLLLFAVSLLACLGAPEWAVAALSVAAAPVIVVAAVRYTIDGRRQLLTAPARSAP